MSALRRQVRISHMRCLVAQLPPVVALAALVGCSANAGSAPDPRSHLSCDRSQIVSTTVDHDDTTVESRTPEQQATQFAASQGGAFDGTQKVIDNSAARIDISFVDGEGKATGVLSYRHDNKLGWRLEQTLSCS